MSFIYYLGGPWDGRREKQSRLKHHRGTWNVMQYESVDVAKWPPPEVLNTKTKTTVYASHTIRFGRDEMTMTFAVPEGTSLREAMETHFDGIAVQAAK